MQCSLSLVSLSLSLSISLATRESAFVHAIASAGVAFAVTRSCAEGTSTMCGCDSHHKGPPGEGWKWGGCSEDAEFGVLVSREFADARENRPDARSAMNRHNNEAGRMVRFESCCSYNGSTYHTGSTVQRNQHKIASCVDIIWVVVYYFQNSNDMVASGVDTSGSSATINSCR